MIHDIVLVSILLLGSFAFWNLQGNTNAQLTIGIVTSIAYVAWGIIHHMIQGDLHRNVVIEYVLIGLIAIVLLLTLAM